MPGRERGSSREKPGIGSKLRYRLSEAIASISTSTPLGKVFTAKPKWKALVLQYGPKFMQAVKMAEKNIPDNTPNKGAARLDAALKFLIQLEPKLHTVKETDLKAALTAVHTTAEANGNLKKTPA